MKITKKFVNVYLETWDTSISNILESKNAQGAHELVKEISRLPLIGEIKKLQNERVILPWVWETKMRALLVEGIFYMRILRFIARAAIVFGDIEKLEGLLYSDISGVKPWEEEIDTLYADLHRARLPESQQSVGLA